MKKLSWCLQWVLLLAGAGWLGYSLWAPVPLPDYAPETWHARRGVHVLSIEGVTDHPDPRYLSADHLRTLLQELQAAGWKSVTVQDVADFYQEGHPLPDKALLLLFENGRRDHLVRCTPILHETGFIGHLAMPTSVGKEWGNHYLKSVDIRRMARLLHWRIVSMGENAIRDVERADGGSNGNYLSHRSWQKGRQESMTAYRQRVRHDFRQAALKLADWTGQVPEGYVFPFADIGYGEGASPAAADLLYEESGRWHRVAFAVEGNSFNGPDRDPLRLNYLQLRNDMEPEALLARMESPAPGPDISLTMKPEVSEAGCIHVYLRYQGPHAYLRLTLEPGRLVVQEQRGAGLVRLAEVEVPVEAAPLDVLLKRNRLRVSQGESVLLPSVSVGLLTSGAVRVDAMRGAEMPEPVITSLEPLYGELVGLPEAGALDLDAMFGVFVPAAVCTPDADLVPFVQLAARGVSVIPKVDSLQALEQLLSLRSANPAFGALIREVAVPASLPEAVVLAASFPLQVFVWGPAGTGEVPASTVPVWLQEGEEGTLPAGAMNAPRAMVKAAARGEDWPRAWMRLLPLDGELP
jgi:hypothetical protein